MVDPVVVDFDDDEVAAVDDEEVAAVDDDEVAPVDDEEVAPVDDEEVAPVDADEVAPVDPPVDTVAVVVEVVASIPREYYSGSSLSYLGSNSYSLEECRQCS